MAREGERADGKLEGCDRGGVECRNGMEEFGGTKLPFIDSWHQRRRTRWMSSRRKHLHAVASLIEDLRGRNDTPDSHGGPLPQFA